MLRHDLVVYDALYTWCKACQGEANNCPPKVQETALCSHRTQRGFVNATGEVTPAVPDRMAGVLTLWIAR